MTNSENMIKFFITMARAQSVLNNRFDRGLNGLSFTEFIILYHLSQAKDRKMRRIDIADKIGFTASGVTRLLLPMEKIGLIKSGPTEDDARVRTVVLASGGKKKLEEALERLELLGEEIIPEAEYPKLIAASKLITEISGRALMV